MAEHCRFNWADADEAQRDVYGPCDRAPIGVNGLPVFTSYFCHLCSRHHWCLPAAEIDGTTDSRLDAVEAAKAAWRTVNGRPPSAPCVAHEYVRG